MLDKNCTVIGLYVEKKYCTVIGLYVERKNCKVIGLYMEKKNYLMSVLLSVDVLKGKVTMV